jgi:hypothetical protein
VGTRAPQCWLQVLASELARTRQIKADEASEALLSVTPYQLKLMLCALLSGRLLEGVLLFWKIGSQPFASDPLHLEDGDDTATRKEQRTGLSVMRRKIEQRKVFYKLDLKNIHIYKL